MRDSKLMCWRASLAESRLRFDRRGVRPRFGDHGNGPAKEMKMFGKRTALMLLASAALVATAAQAQHMKATTLEQAELAGLSAEKRAEVEKRASAPGQTVYEVLTTMLLDNIKSKHAARRIVALDFNRGIAVIEPQAGGMQLINFDTTTLAIK